MMCRSVSFIAVPPSCFCGSYSCLWLDCLQDEEVNILRIVWQRAGLVPCQMQRNRAHSRLLEQEGDRLPFLLACNERPQLLHLLLGELIHPGACCRDLDADGPVRWDGL